MGRAHKAKPAGALPSEQPALFIAGAIEETIQNVDQVAEQYVHSGRTTCKDGERVAAIIQRYQETGSIRATARSLRVSPNTIYAVLRVMERNGKLETMKQRVSGKLATLAEVGTEAMVEAIQSGDMPPQALPIVVGVALDKRAQLEGEASLVVEVRHSVSVDDLVRQQAAIRERLANRTVDLQSTVIDCKALNDKEHIE